MLHVVELICGKIGTRRFGLAVCCVNHVAHAELRRYPGSSVLALSRTVSSEYMTGSMISLPDALTLSPTPSTNKPHSLNP